MTKDKMSFHVTMFSQKSIATCTLQETKRSVCYLLLTILKKCFEKNTDTHTQDLENHSRIQQTTIHYNRIILPIQLRL
jgi:mannose/fructose/N-acetylgalactosamine-specific phosphotransferase system component IID